MTWYSRDQLVSPGNHVLGVAKQSFRCKITHLLTRCCFRCKITHYGTKVLHVPESFLTRIILGSSGPS